VALLFHLIRCTEDKYIYDRKSDSYPRLVTRGESKSVFRKRLVEGGIATIDREVSLDDSFPLHK